MAANYAVYSTHLNGLSPFLTDCDIYIYCSETNVVIVCLDSCGHCGEQVRQSACLQGTSSLVMQGRKYTQTSELDDIR